MWKFRPVAAAIASVVAFAGLVPASRASTLTFEDLSSTGLGTPFLPMPNSYQGFDWTNWFVSTGTGEFLSGLNFAAVSPSKFLFNGFGNPTSIRSGAAFTINSLYLTSVWNDGLSVTFAGSLGGSNLFTKTFVPLATGPTLFTLDWSGIDRIDVSAAGGAQHHGYAAAGPTFAIDNITYNEPVSPPAVPEPESYALMLGGMGMLAALARRKRAVELPSCKCVAMADLHSMNLPYPGNNA